MLRRPSLPVLSGLAVTLALAGCGGSGDDGPTTIDGTGYRTQTPPGWKDAKKVAEGSTLDVDRFYASIVDRQIRDNIIITRERPPASVAGRTVSEIEPAVRAGSAQVVHVPTPAAEPATTLDGEVARTWTIRREEHGRPIVQRQLIALHGGILYVVTLSSLAKTDEGASILQAVERHWHWD